MLLIQDNKTSVGLIAGCGSKSSSFQRLIFATATIALLAFAASLSAQTGSGPITTINLGEQGRNPDFSTFPLTRPFTVGATLPATCIVGQMYFSTSAPAGANLYGCTATNVWSIEGTSSGSSNSGTPSLTINPASLSFGNQTQSTTSSSRAVTLTNSGSAVLSLTGVTLAGPNAADFAQSNNCGATLNAGATCTLTATFTPSTVAAETASVNITDNASNSPQSVVLSGTGTGSSSNNAPVLTPATPVANVATPLTITADRSVTWSLAAGSAGSLSGTTGTTVSYVPPTTLRPQNSLAGCLVAPNDSVFNTRIDNLPLNSNSATWITSMGTNPTQLVFSWGTNIIDNTLTPVVQNFFYTPLHNTPFQIPPAPSRKRETGSLTFDGNNDHHLVSLNHQTCHYFETYQDGLPNSACSTCTGQSGLQYLGANYVAPNHVDGDGSTDAAGLPLQPLILHLSEVESGSVNHALRFTLCTGCINNGTYLWPATEANGSSTPSAPPMGARFRLKAAFATTGVYQLSLGYNGSGYTSVPAVTISGCTVAPTATAVVSGGTVSGLALNSAGSGCTNPTVSFGGPGSGATALALTFSPAAQAVLRALQQYGMILADNGTSGQIQTSTDVTEDPAIMAALNQVNTAAIKPSNFEAVDESSLMLAANSFEVNPANGYVTPAGYALLTATDASGNHQTVPIAIQPVMVGVPNSALTFLAGGPAYNLQAWVNGSSNQALTWSLTSGPGSVTSAGVYTPPATLSSLTPVVLTATAAADNTASASIYATVIPTGANPAGSVRVDVGNTSTYTDSQGNIWQPDAIASETASFSLLVDNYPSNIWGSLTDAPLYETYKYTYGDDMSYGPFVVPNGNYKIALLFGVGSCSGPYTVTVYNNGLVRGILALEAQGQVQQHFDLNKAVNYTCRTAATTYIPAQVTNNLLSFVVRATGGPNAHTIPQLNAFSFAPDPSPATITVDTQGVTTITAGSTAQMYATGWYMSNAVTWSVTGAGSISQTGLYTAPSTAPTSNQTVTVTATSTVNSGISASATLTLQSGS